MVHMWFFELNPNGLFGNTHPCIDPDAPKEQDLNYRCRPTPEFFHKYHKHMGECSPQP
jgi:hypothetical protein